MYNHYLSLLHGLLQLYDEGEARAIAFLVMEEAFGVGRMEILLQSGFSESKSREIHVDFESRFREIKERLAHGEPVQYVLEKAPFCGKSFKVNSDVLIPRPETEELVTLCLNRMKQKENTKSLETLQALDVGTGSGCIAVCLKLALPHWHVEAWDISLSALDVAEENAQTLGADVLFRQVDVLKATPGEGPFDLIVSNPPYVCQKERQMMNRNVTDFEPEIALFVPDDSPLIFYSALAKLGKGCLNDGGRMVLETNRAHAYETAELFKTQGFQETEVRKDSFGNPRIVEALWRKEKFS